MKKQLIVLLFLFAAVSAVHAMGSAPPQSMNTGDAELDRALSQIEQRAGEPGGKEEIEGVMRNEYGVTQREIETLRNRNYRASEIYYMSLLAKQSGKNVNAVAAMHTKGVGWGGLAKKMGVNAGDLNRLRARHHQLERHRIRTEQQNGPAPGPKPQPYRPGGKRR